MNITLSEDLSQYCSRSQACTCTWSTR